MNNSENRKWALLGALAVALWVAGIILINKNGPADHASGSQILAWYKSDSDTIVVGGWLFMLGCLSFVAFVAGLRVRLAEAIGQANQLPGLALAGAAMVGVMGMLTAGVDLAGGIDKNDINPRDSRDVPSRRGHLLRRRGARCDPAGGRGCAHRMADARPAALVGGLRRPGRRRAHRRSDRLARPDLRPADLAPWHERLRAARLARQGTGRCGDGLRRGARRCASGSGAPPIDSAEPRA